jgi:hypothetical protein
VPFPVLFSDIIDSPNEESGFEVCDKLILCVPQIWTSPCLGARRDFPTPRHRVVKVKEHTMKVKIQT